MVFSNVTLLIDIISSEISAITIFAINTYLDE
jgi:hypothetical protein